VTVEWIPHLYHLSVFHSRIEKIGKRMRVVLVAQYFLRCRGSATEVLEFLNEQDCMLLERGSIFCDDVCILNPYCTVASAFTRAGDILPQDKLKDTKNKSSWTTLSTQPLCVCVFLQIHRPLVWPWNHCQTTPGWMTLGTDASSMSSFDLHVC
jgi:hypothetical protein